MTLLHAISPHYYIAFLHVYTDINECAGVNECQQQCHNTIGSYNCSCEVGFTLNSDGRNCTGIAMHLVYHNSGDNNVSSTAEQSCGNGGGCSHINFCAVVNGGTQCSCPTGYQLMNNTQCVGKTSVHPFHTNTSACINLIKGMIILLYKHRQR